MSSFTLLRSQRNDVFRSLSESGLDAHIPKFEWHKVDSENCSEPVSKLVYSARSHEFYFIFDFDDDGDCYATYYPGSKIAVIDEGHHDWSTQIGYVKEWAERLKREIDEPDLWEQLSSIQSGFRIDTSDAPMGEPISAADAIRLREGISLLASRLTEEFNMSQKQQVFVKQKLDYLSEAIERQSRGDWTHTAIGVFASIGMAIGVSAANSDKFWTLIKYTLGTVFKLLIGS